MEETFKEYELITIYSYLKVHSDIAIANSAFTDLAYDSIYHLKRFADLASKMGVLTLPRPIPHEKYENIGIVEFLKENIEEELDAEKQCLILAEKIGNKELSDFLLFISRQEVYHGELLQRALDTITK
jgi:rubrerythrin